MRGRSSRWKKLTIMKEEVEREENEKDQEKITRERGMKTTDTNKKIIKYSWYNNDQLRCL